jgi:hypothetical protein
MYQLFGVVKSLVQSSNRHDDQGATTSIQGQKADCFINQLRPALRYNPSFQKTYPRPQKIPHFIPTQLMRGTLLKRRLVQWS